MEEQNQIGLSPVPEGLNDSDVFGTIVNNQPAQSNEWEEKTKELNTPVSVTLNLPTSFVARLQRVADDSSQSLDEWIASTVIDAIDGKVGAAVIKGPSFAKAGKVTGFTGSVKRA